MTALIDKAVLSLYFKGGHLLTALSLSFFLL